MKSAIIIPARYDSKRFPGKPLHNLAGKPMFVRVYEVALQAAQAVEDCVVYLATDSELIAAEAEQRQVPFIMTSSDCESGSDRVLMAANELVERPEFIVNFQGDSPLTPASYLIKLLQGYQQSPQAGVITLAVRLTWQELQQWRQAKAVNPFSGTSVVIDKDGLALWFSKNILPAIRDEELLQQSGTFSPVCRHVGLYGYSYNMLQTFQRLPNGRLEQLEGLEQLRLLENGYDIKVIELQDEAGYVSMGVDTLDDARQAEAILAVRQEAFS